ncbi:unnamed protein product [Cyclocybe aegerita]|uniref:Chitin synthase n=1 Tax=Cyclocybe aegerita TaxID=1973307 RepID=A0A8S0WRG0_CYCAE|nr:unnamed protein product [Cyclocybe aegerita]
MEHRIRSPGAKLKRQGLTRKKMCDPERQAGSSGIVYHPRFTNEDPSSASHLRFQALDARAKSTHLSGLYIPNSNGYDFPLSSLRSPTGQASSASLDSVFSPGSSPLGQYSYTPCGPPWTHHEEEARRRGNTRCLVNRNVVVERSVHGTSSPTLSGASLSPLADKKSTEFTLLRYTAATCDPDDFTFRNGYTLRSQMLNRSTEILIAITAFNENASMYARTLSGVFANIQDICTKQPSKYWQHCAEMDAPSWQRITVTLVVDGIDEMHDGALNFLTEIGVCQTSIMRKQIDGRGTTAHIFESVISASRLEKASDPTGDRPNGVPVQFILIIKAKNEKKINSHRWVFNALGRMLSPDICVFLDAGTKPDAKAIYRLWEAYHNDPHIGGACGELHTMTGKMLLNPLVAAQHFEYKNSSIFDRPLESVFGHVAVLPGAFSSYRYKAVLGKPLEQYFKGDYSLANRLGTDGMRGMGIFQKNMYLAEDRLLSFEVVAKAGERWVTAYVRASKAETDVPETSAELLGQRRRWLNGSFATHIYALANFRRLYRTAHGPGQLMLYHAQAIYNIVSMAFSWFALANVWIAYSILLDSLSGYASTYVASYIDGLNHMIKHVYVACLIMQFLLAFGNRPKTERIAYDGTLWFFAFLTIYLMVAPPFLSWLSSSVATAVDRAQSKSALAAILGPLTSTSGMCIIASLLYADPLYLIHSSFQYVCMGPSLINVLTVYAYCNVHDVSWGTKGCDKMEILTPVTTTAFSLPTKLLKGLKRDHEDVNAQRKEAVEDSYKSFRTRMVALWLLSNAILAMAVENLGGWANLNNPLITEEQIQLSRTRQAAGRRSYLARLGQLGYWLILLRFVGTVIYWGRSSILRWCRRRS